MTDRITKELREKLVEISKGAGAYNHDPLRHAENCISDMKALALEALALLDQPAPPTVTREQLTSIFLNHAEEKFFGVGWGDIFLPTMNIKQWEKFAVSMLRSLGLGVQE